MHTASLVIVQCTSTLLQFVQFQFFPDAPAVAGLPHARASHGQICRSSPAIHAASAAAAAVSVADVERGRGVEGVHAGGAVLGRALSLLHLEKKNKKGVRVPWITKVSWDLKLPQKCTHNILWC